MLLKFNCFVLLNEIHIQSNKAINRYALKKKRLLLLLMIEVFINKEYK